MTATSLTVHPDVNYQTSTISWPSKRILSRFCLRYLSAELLLLHCWAQSLISVMQHALTWYRCLLCTSLLLVSFLLGSCHQVKGQRRKEIFIANSLSSRLIKTNDMRSSQLTAVWLGSVLVKKKNLVYCFYLYSYLRDVAHLTSRAPHVPDTF